MTTREVADYLRIKERKVYDLLRGERIPASRVTGKWLFPKFLIDQWIASGTKIPVSFQGVDLIGGQRQLFVLGRTILYWNGACVNRTVN